MPQHKQYTDNTLNICRWTSMFLLIFCCWLWRHSSLIDLSQKPKGNSIKKQLHFSAGASEDVVVSSWGQQISTCLGSSKFITHSKANPARRHHQGFLEELLVLVQSELWLWWDSANLFWQVLQNTFFHIQDCLTHTPAPWLQKHDNAGVWKAYCHYWLVKLDRLLADNSLFSCLQM